MAFQKRITWLMLVCMIAVNVQAKNTESKPAEDIDETKGEPRFLDDLFSNMENLDVKMNKFVSQGQTIVKEVQSQTGVNGGTTITKTVTTQSFGGSPGLRFKRDLFDNMEGIMEKVGNRVEGIKDRVADRVTTGINLGHEIGEKIKTVVHRG